MEVVIVPDAATIGGLAADAVLGLLARKPTAVLGLATGSSPLVVYAPTLDHFTYLWTKTDFIVWAWNTMFVSLASTAISIFFFVLITVVLLYFVVKYRARPGHSALRSGCGLHGVLLVGG